MSTQPAAAESELATTLRTHTCGELRKEHVGRAVRLFGQLDRISVDEKTLVLRDQFGKTLVHLADGCLPNTDPKFLKELLTPETVVGVEGTVALRKNAGAKSPAGSGEPGGEVVVEAKKFSFVESARTPLLYDFNDDKVSTTERVRHRYLYLRKPLVHRNFEFRTRLAAALRRGLDEQGFGEVETPMLSQAYTPEQEEAFFAVRERKAIFALPGKRDPHGSLLMASGFDRTFEFARRFQKKPAYGPFQQPEFTVLELMMAFVDEDDLLGALDRILGEALKAATGAEMAPVRRTFEEAQAEYGSDCPDLRFGLAWKDVTELLRERTKKPDVLERIADGRTARALVLEGGAAKLTDAAKAELSRLVAASGKAVLLCAFVGGKKGPVAHTIETAAKAPPGAAAKTSTISPFERELSEPLFAEVGAKEGDAVLCILGDTAAIAGPVRLFAAKLLGLLPAAPEPGKQPPDAKALKHSLVVITRLPYFRWESGRWVVRGDPLTRPVKDELGGDPHRMHGLGFQVVLDGVNVGGGGIRNHDPNTQQEVFTALGYDGLDVDRRWGKFLPTLRFGVPPHGRIAIGFDRLAALLLGLASIDEVIALPKLPDGTDPLVRSPWPVAEGVVEGWLGL